MLLPESTKVWTPNPNNTNQKKKHQHRKQKITNSLSKNQQTTGEKKDRTKQHLRETKTHVKINTENTNKENKLQD